MLFSPLSSIKKAYKKTARICAFIYAPNFNDRRTASYVATHESTWNFWRNAFHAPVPLSWRLHFCLSD